MKRTVEAILIIALSILTVSTTAAYLHNAAAGNRPFGGNLAHGAVKQKLSHSGSAGTATVRQNAAVTPTSSASSSPPVSSLSASGTTSGAANSVVSGWSQADVNRFVMIAQKLLASMTPADWQRVQTAMTTGTETQAQQTLMTVANQHLAPSDEAWIASHLAGDKAFGPVDVELLQQAFRQVQTELTPQELQLLKANHLFS